MARVDYTDAFLSQSPFSLESSSLLASRPPFVGHSFGEDLSNCLQGPPRQNKSIGSCSKDLISNKL